MPACQPGHPLYVSRLNRPTFLHAAGEQPQRKRKGGGRGGDGKAKGLTIAGCKQQPSRARADQGVSPDGKRKPAEAIPRLKVPGSGAFPWGAPRNIPRPMPPHLPSSAGRLQKDEAPLVPHAFLFFPPPRMGSGVIAGRAEPRQLPAIGPAVRASGFVPTLSPPGSSFYALPER